MIDTLKVLFSDKEVVRFGLIFVGGCVYLVVLLWAMAREAGTSGGSSYG